MVKNIELKEIKRVGVLSTLKISALFGLFFGLLSVIAGVLLTMVPAAVASQMGVDASLITGAFLLKAFIQTVIVYSLIGLVLSSLYNGFSRLVGGVKVKLE